MSAQCDEHRFGYCTNAKTCFNVHFRPILAERPVLLRTTVSLSVTRELGAISEPRRNIDIVELLPERFIRSSVAEC